MKSLEDGKIKSNDKKNEESGPEKIQIGSQSKGPKLETFYVGSRPLHTVSDGAIECSNNMTPQIFPEVNPSTVLNFTNVYTIEEAILLDEVWAAQKNCDTSTHFLWYAKDCHLLH